MEFRTFSETCFSKLKLHSALQFFSSLTVCHLAKRLRVYSIFPLFIRLTYNYFRYSKGNAQKNCTVFFSLHHTLVQSSSIFSIYEISVRVYEEYNFYFVGATKCRRMKKKKNRKIKFLHLNTKKISLELEIGERPFETFWK